jgi:ketosteroid isomerase-like protein
MTPVSVSELGETNRIFEEAVAKGDFAALDRVYTADARILPPGMEMIAGRENIRAFWRERVDMGITAVRLRSVEVLQAGDRLIEIGRASVITNGTAAPDAKYVVVWKQEDGAWKWHVDIWNATA